MVSTTASGPPLSVAGTRFRWRAFGVDSLFFAALLMVLFQVVGTSGIWNADEGAALAQAERVHDSKPWAQPWDLESRAQDDTQYPIHLSSKTENGWVPYAKLPLYPYLLGASLDLGDWGPLGVSMAGTLLAAMTTWCIAWRMRPGTERLAFWVAAIGSPLLFNSFTVWAHPLGSALFGVAILGVERVFAGRIWGIAVVGAALLVGTQLRNELVLVACGLGAVLVIAGVVRRDRLVAIAGGVSGVAGVGGYLLGARWARTLSGSPVDVEWSGATRTVTGRLSAFHQTWLDQGTSDWRAGVSLAATALLLAGGYIVASEHHRKVTGFALIAVGATSGALIAALSPGVLVNGVLVAAPVLTIAIGAARLGPWEDEWVRWSAAGVVVSILLVLGQTYDIGGAAEWGGRYFAWMLPFGIAWAVATLDRATASEAYRFRHAALAAIGVATLVLSVQSVRVITSLRPMGATLQEAVASYGRDPDATVLVMLGHPIGRFLYHEVERGSAIVIPPAHEDRRSDLETLANAGFEDAMVVGQTKAFAIERLDHHFEIRDRSEYGAFTIARVKFPAR